MNLIYLFTVGLSTMGMAVCLAVGRFLVSLPGLGLSIFGISVMSVSSMVVAVGLVDLLIENFMYLLNVIYSLLI